ncbi:MAG TPA: hypothetical protein VMV94_04740, partial [Phycisphaerae bacterium]|nr:hypothetical protein [Phycisphaerae bacterium]
DGADQGYLYVGSGNDMVGLMLQGMSSMLGSGQLSQVNVHPPEVRRFREDVSPLTWERVLDYRDIEQEGSFSTIGFRYVKAYRARSDGKNYLYAATFGTEAALWQTATGEPGSWTKVWSSGEVGSIRYMEEHNGVLYLALANDAPIGEQLAKIYATDGAQFWPVVEDGFGNPNNLGMMSLISWNGWLYAGTSNLAQGYEIWKLEGPNGGGPTLVVGAGGPSATNESAITPCVFRDRLYWGAMIYMHTNVLKGLKAADIIRLDANDQWETVVGPNSISGIGSGFNHWPNTYIWSMCEYGGWLYAGTFDQGGNLVNLPETLANMAGGNARVASAGESAVRAGADLYKSPDGVTWYAVTLDGLGNVGNYGFRTMKSQDGYLYLGTANPYDGLEIWRAREGQ